LPPVGRLVSLVIRDTDHLKASTRAGQIAQALRDIAGRIDAQRSISQQIDQIRVRGPAPCPLSRVADHYRVGIEVIAPTAALIQRVLTDMRNAALAVSDGQTGVDVDPVSLL
jgi:primosomal protein N'